jgi:hypothetical protein
LTGAFFYDKVFIMNPNKFYERLFYNVDKNIRHKPVPVYGTYGPLMTKLITEIVNYDEYDLKLVIIDGYPYLYKAYKSAARTPAGIQYNKLRRIRGIRD